jgi:hypothetical protein
MMNLSLAVALFLATVGVSSANVHRRQLLKHEDLGDVSTIYLEYCELTLPFSPTFFCCL